jgi:hypothetical protein
MPFPRNRDTRAPIPRSPRCALRAAPWLALSLSALQSFGCAASTEEPPPPDPSSSGTGGAAGGSGGASAGGSSGTATGGSGGATTGGSAGATTGGSSGKSGAGGSSGASGTSGSGGTGGTSSGSGAAVLTVMSFSLTSCTQTASAAELAAKSDGLTDPKPTQSYADGTLNVDYTVPGQYAQVGVDFAGADMTGCGISVTVRAQSWPSCGVYVVPFFYDMTGGLIAPFDQQRMQFVGEEASNQGGGSIDIAFLPSGALLTAVGRVGLNVYNCAESVIVSDL